MIDKDNIQELFSRSLENHTTPVRPEVWNGLQAKMAAAGVSSVVATKGISALAKWIIGSAAVTGVAVVTTFVVLNSTNEETQTTPPVKVETTSPSKEVETTPIVANQPTQTIQNASTDVNEELEQRLPSHFFQIDKVIDLVDDIVEPQPKVTINQSTSEPFESVAFTGLSDENENPTEPVIFQSSHSEEQATIEKAVIVFPNVFTPLNQDNQEDEYYLIDYKHVMSVEVTILNTKNDAVYRSTDPAFHWNGRLNNEGDFVEPGMYVCVVIYKDLAGKSHKSMKLLEIPKQ